MGLSGMSVGSIILIVLVALVVFGTKRLRNVGEDVGAAVKSFRKGLQDAELEEDSKDQPIDK